MTIWDGISEFVAVVDAGSFSAAAKRLDVSISHISRHVAKLEVRLGVRLLTRTTRSVRLTDAGDKYYRRCKNLTEELAEANQILMGQTAEIGGRIRVSAAGAFAECYVAPALADFAKQHPKIIIEMNFNSRRVNLIDEGFDFAIRYGVMEDSSLIARKLTNRRLIACASPDYLKKRGRPMAPEELKDHSCLRSNSVRWRFRYPDGYRFIRVAGVWSSNNGVALVAAAVRGLGIIYLPNVNLSNELESGLLIPVLEDYCDDDLASWVVYPNQRYLPLRVERAIDFLIEKFQN